MTGIASLLTEIRTSTGGLTADVLATRLGTSRREVEGMLLALRASGLIGPDRATGCENDACASSGGCAGVCPGPDTCPFVIDFGATLELRR